MTADEIRNMKVAGEWNKEVEIEIAAQLAEMNEHLKAFRWYLEEMQEGRMIICTNHVTRKAKG